jgi:leucyl/phenylalanyl-tRNA--protein transferase
MIPWLAGTQPFPPVDTALRSPNGLLAASSDLTVERLLAAYHQGIFPWYADGEPVLWWSPDPRMVLHCPEFRISRSLHKTLRRTARSTTVDIRIDTAFGAVMRACAAPRADGTGTWITPAVVSAYGALHARGLAHSVETWIDGQLAGGLYGVCLGRMFFGESMFARAPDASKLALAALVRILLSEGAPMIDCQQNTRHLASLGGREIARDRFCSHVQLATHEPPIDWARYRHRLNELLDSFERTAD